MTSSSSSPPTAVVLSIAGSDNTAGAGIQADIKAGAAFGVHVATAITAITVQGLGAVQIYPVTVDVLKAQIDSVLQTLPVKAIKVGMLGNSELLRMVADVLQQTELPSVLDPVLRASRGGSLFSSEDTKDAYFQELIPLASIITPNLVEAAQLLGVAQATTAEEMEHQAHALRTLGAQAVLLKGGHSQQRLATDYLVCEQGTLPYSSPWEQSKNTHGTGCTLATAIASGLAQGLALPQAVAAAKTFIQGAIKHADRLGLMESHGPVHPFYQYW